MSKRLKQVAEFLLENPSIVALETVANIAAEAGVHPSALIRFAAAFGFDGFSEMQQLFRDKLVEHSTSYRERVRLSYDRARSDGAPAVLTSQKIVDEFVEGNALSIHQMMDTIDVNDIECALDLLEKAKTIHVVGVRRSYPIANYFVYALRQIKKRAFIVDGSSSMKQEHADILIPDEDLLFAISYTPYAQETRDVLLTAYNANIPIISLSDSRLSPLSSLSNVFFEVKESEVRGIRSLTASLTLVQSLAIAFASRLEIPKN